MQGRVQLRKCKHKYEKLRLANGASPVQWDDGLQLPHPICIAGCSASAWLMPVLPAEHAAKAGAEVDSHSPSAVFEVLPPDPLEKGAAKRVEMSDVDEDILCAHLQDSQSPLSMVSGFAACQHY